MTNAIDKYISTGDFRSMSESERTEFYISYCQSLGLNPASRPFDWVTFQGKLVLYAKRDCTDQLRKRDKISTSILSATTESDIYVVTARTTTPDGRSEDSTGAVSIAGLKGEALANAMMKAESKAKRRATLSMSGMGISDESEIDSIPGAARLPAPEPPKQLAAPDTVANYERLLRECATVEALNAIGADIAEHVPKEQRKDLLSVYAECKSSLTASAAQ